MDFENKLSSEEVHYSRYIASFIKACSEMKITFNYGLFYNWLISLGLQEDEIMSIVMFAFNGRLELEENARKYLTNLRES